MAVGGVSSPVDHIAQEHDSLWSETGLDRTPTLLHITKNPKEAETIDNGAVVVNKEVVQSTIHPHRPRFSKNRKGCSIRNCTADSPFVINISTTNVYCTLLSNLHDHLAPPSPTGRTRALEQMTQCVDPPAAPPLAIGSHQKVGKWFTPGSLMGFARHVECTDELAIRQCLRRRGVRPTPFRNQRYWHEIIGKEKGVKAGALGGRPLTGYIKSSSERHPLHSQRISLDSNYYSDPFYTHDNERTPATRSIHPDGPRPPHRVLPLHPPRPSEKAEAERALAALYQPTYGSASAQEHNNRVLGGYRATLANPNVSDAAKAHARAMLEQAGADLRTQKERNLQDGASGKGSSKSPDAHLARQLGGYKSALKSE
ncbi:3734_t:CDS:2 [Acaulospora colombiana]|uniref:3734_t:CDS:1 n=1 Tax=Acaulospora colombiana TaxID=27376 RepID=A0ACA9NT18_9GLOM|nr:3734_t:CDS:2 [Acaulospora colombiana]